jgi:hypothetical protein
MYTYNIHLQGRIQDFKLGGAHLKELRRAEGGAKIFGIARKNSTGHTQDQDVVSRGVSGGGKNASIVCIQR